MKKKSELTINPCVECGCEQHLVHHVKINGAKKYFVLCPCCLADSGDVYETPEAAAIAWNENN